MEYGFFKEYRKCILAFAMAIVLMCAQYFLKYDLNEVIRIFLQIASGILGGAGIHFSVLKTSEREKLNAAPAGEDSEKYYVDSKPSAIDGGKILPVILLALCLSGSVVITGCSSYEYCTDCTKGPLKYQGEILQLTGGKYIETACFKLDVTKINIFTDGFKWSDLLDGLFNSVSVELVMGDGEFCKPGDDSYYKITLEGNTDSAEKTVMYTKSDAIIPIENKNP